MNKVAIWIIILIVVIGGIWLIVANKDNVPEASAEPIKIGFIGPLTGDLANIGANAKAAVEIAVNEVNAAGGIDGRSIEVVYEDGACAGATAANAVTKLINIDKVPAIIGAACSGETLASAPIAEQGKTVLLSYCSTNPAITTAGDYIFRSVPSDSFQGNFAANHIFTNLSKKKVAVIFINNEWGTGIKNAFTKAYQDLGGQVVLSESYEPTSADLRTQMSKVKTSGAELVYFAGQTDGTITGLKQAKELGITLPFFGADSWDDTKVWSELGAIGNGAMFTTVGSNNTEEFKAKMAEKVGPDNIIYCSNYAYDNIHLMANVMKEVGIDATAIKDALYNVNYTGGVGVDPLKFDANGDPVSANYVIKVVKDGKADVMTQ
ncbi:MAG TPA: penicillin-binding protein activator [Candidatus Paceibacterota bacterium]